MALWRELHFAGRMLANNRWFTAAAVSALALGIGLNTMVFTLVNAVLIQDLPLRNADRIVAVTMRDGRNRSLASSMLDYDDYQRQAHTFAALTLVFGASLNTSDDGHVPEQLNGAYISTNLFPFIGQEPVLGRPFTADDDRLGASPVVMLGQALWKRRYGSDASVIGRTVKINTNVLTIIGVMPEGMQFPFDSELWLPMSQIAPARRAEKRDIRTFLIVGRLADNVSADQATMDLSTIADQLARDYPATNKDIHPVVTPYQRWAVGDMFRGLIMALMGSVMFVLLIACANVANLLLARAAHRSKEISVRVSLGATRWQVVRQLLVESLLLSAVSGAAGFWIAIVGIRWFEAALPPGRPSWMTFTLDPLVFLFIAGLTLGTSLIFGLAPALHVSKTNVNDVMKEGGRGGTAGIRARRWMTALLIGELALTLVLLAGAGYMVRSFLALYRLDIGIETSRIVVVAMTMPSRKYSNAEQRATFLERVNERLAANSAIESASTASSAPYGGGIPKRLEISGRAPASAEPLPSVTMVAIGPHYFDTLRLRLLKGRGFNALDGTSGHDAVIINERLAMMQFPGEDPVGKAIRLGDDTQTIPPTRWFTIIGLVPNVRQNAFQQPGEPTDPNPDGVVYLPVRANPNSGTNALVLVRPRGNLAGMAKVVRDEFRLLDPDMPLYGMRTLDEQLAVQRWPQRVFGASSEIVGWPHA